MFQIHHSNMRCHDWPGGCRSNNPLLLASGHSRHHRQLVAHVEVVPISVWVHQRDSFPWRRTKFRNKKTKQQKKTEEGLNKMNDSHKPGVPASPIAPGNFDRAWNDPPLFRELDWWRKVGGPRLFRQGSGRFWRISVVPLKARTLLRRTEDWPRSAQTTQVNVLAG